MSRKKAAKPEPAVKGLALYFRDTLVGTITDVSGDFPWMDGRFHTANPSPVLIELMRWMTAEEAIGQEPPFAEDLLDGNNWQIVDGNEVRGIIVPGLHTDGTVCWRWRT
jgi:hypothetical protein